MAAALAWASAAGAARGRDRDHDGVPDESDLCPDEIGLAEDGCPPRDADGDGLLDGDDACPELPGPEALRGCPDADDDHDGVVDREDRCVGLAGPADYAGCPPPDADADAVADGADRCPDRPELWNGVADGDGCPDDDEAPALVRYQPGVIELVGCAPTDERRLCGGREGKATLAVASAVVRKLRWRRLEVTVVAEQGRSYGDSVQRARRRAEAVRRQLLAADAAWLAPAVSARAGGPDGRPRIELRGR